MKMSEFIDKIESNPEFQGFGLDQNAAVVLHQPTALKTRIPITSIENMTWEEMEPLLTGKRDLKVLYHMSRVVGYYSRIENWNASKQGELRDRHKGEYRILAEAV